MGERIERTMWGGKDKYRGLWPSALCGAESLTRFLGIINTPWNESF
jgi:hypothetical protein